MVSPSSSVIEDVFAVRVCSTCGVPLIVGAPAADVLVDGSSTGPVTVAVGLLVNCRGLSSLVQIAPVVVQDRLAGRVMPTSSIVVGFDGDLPEVVSSVDSAGAGDVSVVD